MGDGEPLWEQACKDGWEGLVVKRADAPYLAGRTRNWLKFKCENAQEFVIGGYTDPQRSRVGFGALLLGYYDADGDLVYAGKVGTGFDTRTLQSLHGVLAGLERTTSPFAKGQLPSPRGVHWVTPSSSARSASPSGPTTASCATPGSRACATTRTRVTSCGRCRLNRPPGSMGA